MTGAKGIENQERAVTEHYRKSTDGLDGVAGSGSIEMNGDHVREVDGEEHVNEEVLAQGLQTLEAKKKHWYTYMTTKDFWIVLILG